MMSRDTETAGGFVHINVLNYAGRGPHAINLILIDIYRDEMACLCLTPEEARTIAADLQNAADEVSSTQLRK